jgi:hypothetical protein
MLSKIVRLLYICIDVLNGYQFFVIVLAYLFFVWCGISKHSALSIAPIPPFPQIQSKLPLHHFIACDCVASKMMSSTTTTAWLAEPSFTQGITTVGNRVLFWTNSSRDSQFIFYLF